MRIGIDLGGTNIAAGLVDDSGNLRHKISRPTDAKRGFQVVSDEIGDMIEELIGTSRLQFGESVASIGIGIPGIAAPDTGLVKACVNLNWYDVPLGERLRRRFNCPVFIDNDATVASAAEFLIAQRGVYRDAVLLTLGTGIGSGILVSGRVVSGAHGIGAEVGHMIVGEAFYDCNCGRNGCLETFASSTAVIRYAQKLMGESDEPSMLRDPAGNVPDGEAIFCAAKNGDELALRVVDRMTRYLAIGIMNLVSVLDPEVVLLGGGLAMAGDFLLDRVREQMNSLRYFLSAPLPEIALARLQNDAGIIGAAVYSKIR